MSAFWSSRIKKLSPYVAGEQPKDKKIIKLNTNENPYPPSPAVIEAIQKAVGDLRLYPDPSALELREAVAERFQVGADQVFASNGSDEALALAFAAFFESGKDAPSILFPDITYSFYPVYADLWEIPYRKIALKEDFSLDPADFSSFFPKCGGIIFPNPNAPTGIGLDKSGVMEIVKKNADRVVIVDEAYCGFADDLSVVPFIKENPNLLIVQTLSKFASLAGLRVGFALGSAELVEGLCRARDSFNSYPLDRLALAGATAAVKDTAYYENITRKVIAARERVARELIAMGFEVLPSQANFLFIHTPKLAGKDFSARLRDAGILVRRFNAARIEDFLRVSIGTDADMDFFLEICRKLI